MAAWTFRRLETSFMRSFRDSIRSSLTVNVTECLRLQRWPHVELTAEDWCERFNEAIRVRYRQPTYNYYADQAAIRDYVRSSTARFLSYTHVWDALDDSRFRSHLPKIMSFEGCYLRGAAVAPWTPDPEEFGERLLVAACLLLADPYEFYSSYPWPDEVRP